MMEQRKMERLKQFMRKNRNVIFTGLVFAFFFFTMFFQLNHSALWGDEWNEYYYSQASLKTGDLYQKVIGTFQPPLYNFIMHFWLKINDTAEWFRFFNIVIGMITGVFIYLTLKRLYHTKMANFVLCALAMSHQWVYCIQECSEYALMIVFLAGAVFFYVELEHKFSYRNMLLFLLLCVGAVYSQYGSAFAVLPLLLFFYLEQMFRKNGSVGRKIAVTVSYAGCFLVFAIPLYYFFLRVQMGKNEIAEHTVTFGLHIFKDIFTAIGNLIGYFYVCRSTDAWVIFWGAVSICLVIGSVCLFIKGKLSRIKKNLLFLFWTAYLIHYMLVELHIYAMMHPNQSGGFYWRYSYFYFPLFCVALPIILYEGYRCFKSEIARKGFLISGGTGLLCLYFSFFALLQNWEKALDDQFAVIWMSEKGWKDTTYLIGNASDGFHYYVSREEGFSEDYFHGVCPEAEIDLANLPERFWLWRTNWGGEMYQITLEAAEELGYEVTVYCDAGYTGQLAYCTK